MSQKPGLKTGKYNVPIPWSVWPALSYSSTYELPAVRGLVHYRRLVLQWLRYFVSFTWAIREET